MAMCIACGDKAISSGFACISIGDGVVTRGAFQIKIGDRLTLPDIDAEQLKQIIFNLKDTSLSYQAMTEQKYAPPDFGQKATEALDIVVGILEKRLEAATPPPVSTELSVSTPDLEEATSSEPEQKTLSASARRRRNRKNKK